MALNREDLLLNDENENFVENVEKLTSIHLYIHKVPFDHDVLDWSMFVDHRATHREIPSKSMFFSNKIEVKIQNAKLN